MLPEYVTTKVSYSWNKAAIKDHLKSGKFPNEATLQQSNTNHNLTKKVK